MLKKNIEEVLFFTAAVIYMLLITFSRVLDDINIVVLIVMLLWINRLVKKNNN